MKRSVVRVHAHPPSNNMQFIFGPIIFVLGLLMMRYKVQIANITGKLDFAEQYLGDAGTFKFYSLFGLGMTIVGALWFFGLTSVITTPLTNMLPGR